MKPEKETYLTIKKPYVGTIYKEKSSKFIGYAFPVTSENEIKTFLGQVKKEHSKARHWCYAWQIGIDDIKYRANDDGEPNNSAGKPIYGQILSKNITNVLIIVVRYYGGTKLGVGGLISAYRTAAQNVLSESVIIKETVKVIIGIKFEYKEMNNVMRIIKQFHANIINSELNIDCYYKITIKKGDLEDFLLKKPKNIALKVL